VALGVFGVKKIRAEHRGFSGVCKATWSLCGASRAAAGMTYTQPRCDAALDDEPERSKDGLRGGCKAA
jgi:hypothetical protein